MPIFESIEVRRPVEGDTTAAGELVFRVDANGITLGAGVTIPESAVMTTQAPIVPTGVVAGTPGHFEPLGATVPADLDALQDLGDLGQTLTWLPGQYVILTDSSEAHWDGSVWQPGQAV